MSVLLPVILPGELLEDEEQRPKIGDMVRYSLTFEEADSGTPAELTSTVTAWAETDVEESSIQPISWDGTPSGPPIFPALLRGTGWTAMWLAPRPVRGSIELSGTFHVSNEAVTGPEAHIHARVRDFEVFTLEQAIDSSDPWPISDQLTSVILRLAPLR